MMHRVMSDQFIENSVNYPEKQHAIASKKLWNVTGKQKEAILQGYSA